MQVNIHPLKEATVEFLTGRKAAYCHIFPPDSRAAEIVIRDLGAFCRAGQTCIAPTDRETYVLLGRQEVFLRIAQNVNMSITELYQLYGGPQDE